MRTGASRRAITISVAMTALLCGASGCAVAPSGGVRPVHVSDRRDVMVLADSRTVDVNLTAVRTGAGLVVVDALSSPGAGLVAKERLRRWAGNRIVVLILTHAHGDHVWGAQSLDADFVIASVETREDIPLDLTQWRATQEARLEMLEGASDAADAESDRRTREVRAVREDLRIMASVEVDQTLPDETVASRHAFERGRHDFELRVFPSAHTRGDLVVSVPSADLLVVGDLIFSGQLPFIGGTAAGSAEQLVAIHEELLSMTSPSTVVVPGHGPPGGPELIEDRLDYLRALIDVIDGVLSAGGSLEDARTAAAGLGFERMNGYERFHEPNVERVWEERRRERRPL